MTPQITFVLQGGNFFHFSLRKDFSYQRMFSSLYGSGVEIRNIGACLNILISLSRRMGGFLFYAGKRSRGGNVIRTVLNWVNVFRGVFDNLAVSDILHGINLILFAEVGV